MFLVSDPKSTVITSNKPSRPKIGYSSSIKIEKLICDKAIAEEHITTEFILYFFCSQPFKNAQPVEIAVV